MNRDSKKQEYLEGFKIASQMVQKLTKQHSVSVVKKVKLEECPKSETGNIRF